METDSSEQLNRYAKSLLHGKTCNRWFDKTFTMVVYKNGRYGMNVEHTWADAPITGKIFEGNGMTYYHKFIQIM